MNTKALNINIYSKIPKFGWKIANVYEDKNINATVNDLRTSILFVAFATLLIIFSALYILINRMIKSIGQLTSLMGSVSEGELTVRSDIQTNDEIRELGNNFNTRIDNMNPIITIVNGSASNIPANSESLSTVAEETNASSEEVEHAELLGN